MVCYQFLAVEYQISCFHLDFRRRYHHQCFHHRRQGLIYPDIFLVCVISIPQQPDLQNQVNQHFGIHYEQPEPKGQQF